MNLLIASSMDMENNSGKVDMKEVEAL